MDIPEEVVQQLIDIQSALDSVEEHLQPFLEAGPKQITAQLTPLERVKTHLALAQAAVVLYTLGRQLDAAKLDNHTIQKELERLAKYERKVQEAVAADDLARTKPGASLNIDAANRFIDAAIPDLSKEQKAALRSRAKRTAPGATAQDGTADHAASSSRDARGKPSKQPRQPESKPQQKQPGSKAAQDFLQELVSEVAEHEQLQDQHLLAAAEQTRADVVDADTFLQDVMASLDGSSR